MKKLITTTILTILLAACATSSSKLNSVSLGMSKAQVIQVLGTPQSVSAKDGLEYLIYTLGERMTVQSQDAMTKIDQQKGTYFVRLKNGVVESYGKVGDFDSTKTPELNINIRER
jgi:outer membrane protein assembly factor BamE (lipoprotein component of BamABCDE complex)